MTDPSFLYDARRACVTGGAGFIGSHLVDALAGRGAVVTVLDDLSSGRAENLDAHADRVRLVRGSILDADALSGAVEGAEIVFHLAALTSVPRSVEEPVRYHEVDATGTLRVLEAARAAGVRRVVFSASSSAYGDQPESPKVETMRPDPLSPYAAAKCCGELMLRAYAACYGLETVSLRYFNVFGPRQAVDSPYAGVIPRFAEAMLAGRRPVIYGDGRQTRDFTPVANAVQATLLAGAARRDLRGEVVNVATGESRTLIELVEAMAAIVGVEPAYDLAPARTGDVLHSLADLTEARRLLGYEPAVGFEEALRATVGYYGGGTEGQRD